LGQIIVKKEKGPTKKKKGTSYLHRAKIENAAVDFIWEYYDKKLLPIEIRDVSKLNKGWDIEVVLDDSGSQLNVEVKGLSSKNPLIGLTPNEYKHFKNKTPHYRLVIVTNCLSIKRGYEIYWNGKAWRVNKINSAYKTTKMGEGIMIKEMMSAQIYPK